MLNTLSVPSSRLVESQRHINVIRYPTIAQNYLRIVMASNLEPNKSRKNHRVAATHPLDSTLLPFFLSFLLLALAAGFLTFFGGRTTNGSNVELPANMATSWFQKQFALPARARGSYLITDTVVGALPEIRNYKIGLLNLFVQHTSCALSLNENVCWRLFWGRLVVQGRGADFVSKVGRGC
jgi:hypothetical protein